MHIHVERHNLTIRTLMKRFTRLCLGFSKKLENLEAAVAMFLAYYNFVWRTGTRRRAGLGFGRDAGRGDGQPIQLRAAFRCRYGRKLGTLLDRIPNRGKMKAGRWNCRLLLLVAGALTVRLPPLYTRPFLQRGAQWRGMAILLACGKNNAEYFGQICPSSRGIYSDAA